MITFNMTNAGVTTSNVFNQTNAVIMQQVQNSNTRVVPKTKFVVKNQPSFSSSSSSGNKNLKNNKITRSNG